MMKDMLLMTDFLSYLRHSDYGIIFIAGVPCFALHRLPGNCRPFRTFLGNEGFLDFLVVCDEVCRRYNVRHFDMLQNIEILRFKNSPIRDESSQADMESEARNACYKDQTLIKL